MKRLFAWLREHKSAVAVAVALFAVWRVARFALASTWVLAGWDDVLGAGDWALERWWLVATVLVAVFVAVFLTVRALIPWLDRRA